MHAPGTSHRSRIECQQRTSRRDQRRRHVGGHRVQIWGSGKKLASLRFQSRDMISLHRESLSCGPRLVHDSRPKPGQRHVHGRKPQCTDTETSYIAKDGFAVVECHSWFGISGFSPALLPIQYVFGQRSVALFPFHVSF